MRSIKLLGPCLLTMLALGASAASPALATLVQYGEDKETEKEHAEFLAFANCPFGAGAELDCSWAQTSYTEQWPSKKIREAYEAEHGKPAELLSQLTAGKVTVPLKLSIILRGGIAFENEGEERWVGAQGAETIQAVPQAAQPLNKDVDTALLSPAELNRYNYYVKISKETKVTAAVELAGPASAIQVNVGHLLEEQGTAFAFPVKLKLSNPFVGPDCYAGSDANPIVVELTTGASGALHGKNGSGLRGDRHGFILTLTTNTLVNNTFASPGVEGCGIEGGADAAIDSALGLPSASGQNRTVLNGTLKLATGENAKEGLEGKI